MSLLWKRVCGPAICGATAERLVSWVMVVAVVGAANALSAEPGHNGEKAEIPRPMFMPDVNRHATYLESRPDQQCPIPTLPVTKDTYMKWLEFSRHLRYADDPASHELYGPRHFLPVLAKYVESGDRKYGLACMRMIDQFDAALRKETADDGRHELFGVELPYLAVYRKYLVEGRLMSADDPEFRDLAIHFARTLHPWNTPVTHWRGPMHRSQGEGVARGLVARWYPQIEEAAEWKEYSDLVYQDWWRFRDFPQNDTGYLFLSLMPLFLHAWIVGDDAFFTDPGMKPLWDRLVHEVSPDGSVPPYGAHGGWNSMSGTRIAMLEMLAAKTGDGTYRFVAHRMMNYLVYQRMRYREDHLLIGIETTEPLSLAYLFADERIAPQPPQAGSRILTRKETLRFAGHDKARPAAILGALDPAANRNSVDCGLVVTDQEKPSKLVLRSGWAAGDFFALVDLFPRHDPLNTPGILGMTRWGAVLTTAISAKDWSDENRVVVEDARSAPAGVPPPETEVLHFEDSPLATYACARVAHYDGRPITCTRQFLFVKNALLVVRDDLTATAECNVTLASVFNTQNIGPAVCANAAMTYLSEPVANMTGLRNPPVDLLVYHCPQPDARLLVRDRMIGDRRAWSVPAQLRYERSGVLRPGASARFTTLFRPQPPAQGMTAVASARLPDNVGRLPLATGDIAVLVDDEQRTVLRVRSDDRNELWLVLNAGAVTISDHGVRTSARAAVVLRNDGLPQQAWSFENRPITVESGVAPTGP